MQQLIESLINPTERVDFKAYGTSTAQRSNRLAQVGLQSLIILVWILIGGVACAAQPHKAKDNPLLSAKKNTSSSAVTKHNKHSAGEKILKVGQHMALVSKEIVQGSCWNYINTVYHRAGYPQKKRQYVLRGKKNSGPYAKPDRIQPGDWLYYINHSYNNIEHSGIFVRWANKKQRLAVILSYGGEARKKPGRYRNYDISHVYTIIRAKN